MTFTKWRRAGAAGAILITWGAITAFGGTSPNKAGVAASAEPITNRILAGDDRVYPSAPARQLDPTAATPMDSEILAAITGNTLSLANSSAVPPRPLFVIAAGVLLLGLGALRLPQGLVRARAISRR